MLLAKKEGGRGVASNKGRRQEVLLETGHLQRQPAQVHLQAALHDGEEVLLVRPCVRATTNTKTKTKTMTSSNGTRAGGERPSQVKTNAMFGFVSESLSLSTMIL